MSNAATRRALERQSAPVIAFLIDNGWVFDDCGILNGRFSNIREGILIASRVLRGQVEVPVPEMQPRTMPESYVMRAARELL